MLKKTKLAIIVAGGNGAGKSTFINNKFLKDKDFNASGINYINADDWQKKNFGYFDNTNTDHALQAQKWAENERNRHLENGLPFIAETVFSHESKVELIKEAKGRGFDVNLYHISLDNADMALDRIKDRVLLGGHDVDADKVKARYERIKELIVEATKYSDKTFVYDNSVRFRPHQNILDLEKEKIIEIHATLPAWVSDTYKKPLAEFYQNLKNKFTPMQAKYFKDMENHIKEFFKDHPDLLEVKLNALNEKIQHIIDTVVDKGIDR